MDSRIKSKQWKAAAVIATLLLITGMAAGQTAGNTGSQTESKNVVDKIISGINNLTPDIGPLSVLSQNTGSIDATRDNIKVGDTFKVFSRTTVDKDGVEPTRESGYCINRGGIDTDSNPTLLVTDEVSKLPEASASSIGRSNSFELISEEGWTRLKDREYQNGQYSTPDIPAGSDVLVYNFTLKSNQSGAYAFRLNVPCQNHFDINNDWEIIEVESIQQPSQPPTDNEPGDSEEEQQDNSGKESEPPTQNQTSDDQDDQEEQSETGNNETGGGTPDRGTTPPPPEKDRGPAQTILSGIVDLIQGLI